MWGWNPAHFQAENVEKHLQLVSVLGLKEKYILDPIIVPLKE